MVTKAKAVATDRPRKKSLHIDFSFHLFSACALH